MEIVAAVVLVAIVGFVAYRVKQTRNKPPTSGGGGGQNNGSNQNLK